MHFNAMIDDRPTEIVTDTDAAEQMLALLRFTTLVSDDAVLV